MQVRNDRFVFSNILNHTVPVNTGTANAIKYSTAIMQALNLLVYLCSLDSSMGNQKWKVSKAIRNDKKVEEGSLFLQALDDNKTNKEKEIKLIFPNYNVDSTVDLSRHPPLKLCQKEHNRYVSAFKINN